MTDRYAVAASDLPAGNPRHKRRISAPIFGLFVFFSISHRFPPTFEIFRAQRVFSATARVVHGFFEFISFSILKVNGMYTPLAIFITLSGMGFAVSVMTVRIWRSGKGVHRSGDPAEPGVRNECSLRFIHAGGSAYEMCDF